MAVEARQACDNPQDVPVEWIVVETHRRVECALEALGRMDPAGWVARRDKASEGSYH